MLLEDKRVVNCVKEMKNAEIFFYSRKEGRWINNIFIVADHIITKYIPFDEAIEIVKGVSFAFSKVDWKSDDHWWFVESLREAKDDCCNRGIEPPVFDCLIDAFLDTQNLKSSETEVNSPLGYEYTIANKLQQLGFTAQATKASGDQGADIIAEKDGKSFAIQCRLYSKPVGNQAVQEAYAAATFYQKNLEGWL